ncbi:MAG TPA: hypothetical protein VMF86_06465 [Stellaceae bacterium]|nr:hypothetical protein [Stellaceae bacterium]
MAVRYEINGYDQATDDLSLSLKIPASKARSTLRIAGVPEDDDRLGSYPLSAGQMAEIAGLLGKTVDRNDLVFFLEPYAETDRKAG